MSISVQKFGIAGLAGALSVSMGASGALAQGVQPGLAFPYERPGRGGGGRRPGRRGRALIGGARLGSKQETQGT